MNYTRYSVEPNFYQRRVELLQKWQSKMRDPERAIACDIIANGQTLPSENAGDRYKIPVEAQQVAVPAGWALVPINPTEEMIAAGRATPCTDEEDMDDDYRVVYKAMLAAAQGAKLEHKPDWSAA